MHFVVFGLGMSSSWGNGHCTLWRGLVKALARKGHTLTFYEKDAPYYASTRDGWLPPAAIKLRIYSDFIDIRAEATRELAYADVGMTTSYCADGVDAAHTLLNSSAEIKAFYDLDTPVTLSALNAGERLSYLPHEGLRDFDLVLSYTGGRALDELSSKLSAQFVAPLYGWVDGETHFPAPPMEEFRSDLSYLGTFAADRQQALQRLFIEVAQQLPQRRFSMAGAMYPDDFPWAANLFFVRHLPPSLHPAFFCSSRATLNVTRSSMAAYGFCPSGRLFEAAACGVPVFSDSWEGLETFFTPGEQILLVNSTEDVCEALLLPDADLQRLATAAREHTLACHTASQRVVELESICERARQHASQSLLAT